MPFILSPLGGAGAQFLNNNGEPLSGGLIYTYAAGTVNPQPTYTTNAGNVAHPNPIVLDSSGRVPGGQVWTTYGTGYKFVLNTSAGVTLVTWDNVYDALSPTTGPITAVGAISAHTSGSLARGRYNFGNAGGYLEGGNGLDLSIYGMGLNIVNSPYQFKIQGVTVVDQNRNGYFTEIQENGVTLVNKYAPLSDICRVYRSGNQSVATGASVNVTFNAEGYDNNTMHDLSVNPDRVTIKTAGLYRITAQTAYAANATGRRASLVRRNGGAVPLLYSNAQAVSAGFTTVFTSGLLNLVVNDYLTLEVTQDSGGPLDVLEGSGYTFLEVERIRSTVS